MLPGLPRFRGLCFESDGGWKHQITFSLFGCSEEFEDINFICIEIFPTKEICLRALRAKIEKMIKDMAKKFPDWEIDPETFLDVKSNSKRKFKEN